MTELVTAQVQSFARSLAELKLRFRLALAGELAQQVAYAVGDVVRAVLAGEPLTPRTSSHSSWDAESDPWEVEDEEHGFPPPVHSATSDESSESAPSIAPLAVAAAVHAVRWWLGRSGGLAGAIALGLGVGAIGLSGGTVVRALLASFTAAADLLAITSRLGDSAVRFESV